jgi:hypothetical protein
LGQCKRNQGEGKGEEALGGHTITQLPLGRDGSCGFNMFHLIPK